MTSSFLMRFQESYEESPSETAATGTETKTKIIREQADKDSAMATPQLFPVTTSNAGTATHTRVRNEHADTDSSMQLQTIPLQHVLGTTTRTAVKTEAPDDDKQQKKLTVLPKCSLF